MTAARRLAAILVADVVGYSRLIGAVLFGAAILAAHGAFAFEGHYVAGDRAYRQDLTIKKRADGRFDVSAVVGTEGCTGLVDARGAVEGDALKAEAGFDGGTCVLALARKRASPSALRIASSFMGRPVTSTATIASGADRDY
jgi:hypothetical protein